METAVGPAITLFGVEDIPNVVVEMWSHKLRAWVYLVPRRTGKHRPGTYEITAVEVARMQQLINDGWDADTAIFRTMGVRPVA